MKEEKEETNTYKIILNFSFGVEIFIKADSKKEAKEKIEALPIKGNFNSSLGNKRLESWNIDCIGSKEFISIETKTR